MPNRPGAVIPLIACPECGVPVFDHPAAVCLDVMVARLMGDPILYFPRADVSAETGGEQPSTISVNMAKPTELAQCWEYCETLNVAEQGRRTYTPAPAVRPYSTDKRLAFDVLDRVEGDLLSGMAVAVEKLEEPRVKLEVNKAINKWWVKIYFGERGGSIQPVIDPSAALAVTRAVILADAALKEEAGPEESIIK